MYNLFYGKIYPEIKIITGIKNIEGLELSKKISKTYPIKLIDIQDVEKLSSELLDEESDYGIILIDNNNIIKKTYFLNIVELKNFEKNSVNTKAYLYGASKGMLKAWKNYYSKGVKEYNLWKNLKPSERQGWLELAISCQNIDYENPKNTIKISGHNINCYDDFYCTLGEALNGPGGYFGRNLDSLIDCICSHEFGTKNLKKIIWENSKTCRWKLKNNFNHILNVFQDYKIDVELL